MNERETKLLRTIDMSGRGFRAWVALLVSVLLWGAFAYSRQLRFGLVETGMRDQISWGLYISNFVFFIGISHAGTLISAILRVTDAGWRTPITRMAEGITVVALCIGGSMVLVDMGRPDRALNLFRYGRIQSPIVWDVLGVSTYLTGCILYFYLPLIPDLGIVASRPGIGSFRRGLYRLLSLGWTGSPEQWRLLNKSISIMAVAIIPLAISVHTVVSWIFAMTLRPGWDSSVFGPYFVVGAIYSGAAAVVLAMCLLRRIFHLEDYLKPVHFRNLGLLLLSFSMLYLYFNVNEYLTLGYKFRGPEKVLLDRLFYGDYASYFWVVAFVGVFLPMMLMTLVLGPKRYRDFTVPGLGVASLMVVIGAWAKRYLIVVPTLSSPFLPIQGVPEKWSHYAPSWVEWSITAAAFAAFLLLYTLLAKTFPVVSIWETRETGEPVEEAPAAAAMPFRPKWRPALPTIVLLACAFLWSAPAARGQGAAKGGKAPQPTSISVGWQALKPEDAPRMEDARIAPAASGTQRFYLDTKVLSYPWAAGSSSKPKESPIPVIAVSAQLKDAKGQPLAYQAVSFGLKTSLGRLEYGARATDGDGKVQLIIRDHRFGQYPVDVAYGGDDDHQTSHGVVMVDFGPRPAPGLPDSGVLIAPTFSAAIGLPFLFFYGSMWCVFAYVFGYLVFWRMRREGAGAVPNPAPALDGGTPTQFVPIKPSRLPDGW
jgi:molybdopterin-containing oxidoreductase family membrane subunit